MTASSAILRVSTSSESVRPLFSHVPQSRSSMALYGRKLEVVRVDDDADTWLAVLTLLQHPLDIKLSWVRAGRLGSI